MGSKIRYRDRRSLNCESNSPTPKATERRSKNGCLTCRRRKKKCDEVKPICGACRRNFLQCVWPEDAVIDVKPKDLSKEQGYSFSNLTMHDLKHLYSFNGTPEVLNYDAIKPNNVVNEFIILSTNKNGKLQLRKNGKINLESHEFPSIEELRCSDDDETHPNTEVMTQNIYHEPITEENILDENADELFDYKDFFDLQWGPNQIFEKSDFTFNWFTRFDTVEQFPSRTNNDEQRPLDEGISSGNQNTADEEETKIDYNYLYDKNDPLALTYNAIMGKFDNGDFSMLTQTSRDERFLIYACVNFWLPKMGPQDTHPLLTTAATFTSHFESNHIVKEVFLCCGATYLEWYDHKIFGDLSNVLYESSLALIEKYLNENAFHGTEAWLLASYQLLCLRNKATLSTTVDDCVYCLKNSYRIIKATYYISEKDMRIPNRVNHGSNLFGQDTSEQVQELSYEIENKVLEIEEQIDSVKNHLILQAHERMFIESFIYNYSVAILWSTDISELPNPFTFFKEMNHLLRCPIYHCELEWMNNPILGAAAAGFEILAKVSYITRLPMPLPAGSIWIKRCHKLSTMSQFYTSPVIPRTGDKNSKINESCLLNVYLGKIIAKVCYLLLCKIIGYETYKINESQAIVDEIMEILEKIPERNLMWGILLWPIIVVGIFVIKPTHQMKIMKYLNNIGEMLHKLSILNANLFLENIWAKKNDDKRLNAIFDRKGLVQVNP